MAALILVFSSIFSGTEFSFFFLILLLISFKFFYKQGLGYLSIFSVFYIMTFKLFWVESQPEALAKLFLPFGQDSYSACLSESEYQIMSSIFSRKYPEKEEREDQRNWHKAKPIKCSDAKQELGGYGLPGAAVVYRSSGLNLANVNNLDLNFWEGQPSRSEIPYFIKYEFDDFIHGKFVTLVRDAYMITSNEQTGASRVEKLEKLTKIDTIFFNGTDKISFLFFEESQRLFESLLLGPRFLQYPSNLGVWMMGSLVYVVALAIILISAVNILFRRDSAELLIVVLTVSLLSLVMLVSKDDYIGPFTGAFGGGDDGIVHYWWGNLIAESLRSFDLHGALRGQEAVFWFTPGFRYIRAFENIVFDGALCLYLIVLFSLPVVLYRLLLKLECSNKFSLMVTIIFLFSPLNFFSFVEYIRLARLGYGETLSFLCLLLALSSVIGNSSSFKYNTLLNAFAVPQLLFVCWFVRPNLALVCAGIWFVVAIRYLLNMKNFASRKTLLIFLCSSLIWFFPLIHNVIFGHQWTIISASGSSVSLPYSIFDYWLWLFEGEDDSEVRKHFLLIFDNFGSSYFSVPLSALSGLMLILGVTFGMGFALRGASSIDRVNIAVLYSGFVFAFSPMLFVFYPQARYGMVGLELLLIVFFVSVWRLTGRQLK